VPVAMAAPSSSTVTSAATRASWPTRFHHADARLFGPPALRPPPLDCFFLGCLVFTGGVTLLSVSPTTSMAAALASGWTP
jgi:hypothetical protein